MCSVEQELYEIEQNWELKYLEETGNHRYVVTLTKDDIALLVSIPESYPDSPLQVEFTENEMGTICKTMQQNVLRSCQRNLAAKIGKPMLKSTLDEFLHKLELETKTQNSSKEDSIPSSERDSIKQNEKPRKGARMAACFHFDKDNDNPDKKTDAKTNNNFIKKTKSQALKMNSFSEKKHGKASPMKTARDVINRLKWDEQLKDEEFVVGYEDRFIGIIEIPWSDLNWQDDIAATGPKDKLAIPEHRVQYFKWNSEIVWRKETRTDFIFGSTGSNIDIVEYIHRFKQPDSNKPDSGQDGTKIKNLPCYLEEVVKDVLNDILSQLDNVSLSKQIEDDSTKTECEGNDDWNNSGLTLDQPPKKQRQKRHGIQSVKDKHWKTNISRKLTGILRHNRMGFVVDEEGYVEVNEILGHRYFKKQSVSEEEIVTIVNENEKKRFTLEGERGQMKIRANQGHSVPVDSLHLEIIDSEKYQTAVHGTNFKYWKSILENGLNRMKRNHIHLATGEPGNEEVVSGIRKSSNCFIYIDLEKAIADGIQFFISDNEVILTEGDNGVILSKYFKEVFRIIKGKRARIFPLLSEMPEEQG